MATRLSGEDMGDQSAGGYHGSSGERWHLDWQRVWSSGTVRRGGFRMLEEEQMGITEAVGMEGRGPRVAHHRDSARSKFKSRV